MAVILLLAVALRAVSSELTGVIVGIEPGRTPLTSFSAIAVIVGWLTVRRSGWPFRLTGWLAAGFAAVLLQNAGLWDELFEFAWAGVRYGVEWVDSPLQGLPLAEPAALVPLRLAWLRLSAGVRIELDVIGAWLAGFFAGEPSLQAEAVAFAWGAVLWVLGLYAGLVMRWTGAVLAALLPAGTVLGIALAYTGAQSTVGLSVFLLVALLLTAVQAQYSNERRWADRAMIYAEDMRLDFFIAASLLVAGIVTSAYLVPQLQLGTAVRLFIDRAADSSTGRPGPDEDPGEVIGLPRFTPPPPFFDQYRRGGLPRSHLLGAGPELADELALTVRVFGEEAPGGTRYYWRGLSYEVYTGPGWETGETETVRFQAGWLVPGPLEPYSRPIRQEVRVIGPPSGIAYAAGEILSADHTFTVAWRIPGPGIPDVFGVRIETDVYTIDSSYPYFLSDPLRAAGTEYPDWVTDRYLGLPETLPLRVGELAASLTEGAGSPFDAALAIETYLRDYEYTLNLGPPPPGRDLADYFLFDLQRGYCDYFATAMVVLARSSGLPARLAIGYAGGEYDPETERYMVSALNAHSWPEIYFPGFGWVPFEPTAGVVAIDRSEGEALPAYPPPMLPPLRAPPPVWLRSFLLGAGFTAFAAIVLIAAQQVRKAARIRRLDPEAFFSDAFQWLYFVGKKLEVRAPARATPIETARALTAYLDALRARNSLARRISTGGPDLARLTESYIRSQYGRDIPGEEEKGAGIRALGRLRAIVFFARIERRIRKISASSVSS